MKFVLGSDLHLEFGPLKSGDLKAAAAKADTLVLAGDICVADHLVKAKDVERYGRKHAAVRAAEVYKKFFEECSERFTNVLYIAGNHEHYNGEFGATHAILKDTTLHLPNIHVMNRDTKIIEDTMFIGVSLWTDMNREDPTTCVAIENYMNDFRVISNDGSRFRVEDAIQEHKKDLEYIDIWSNNHEKIVVVGHHAPTKLSTHPRYKEDFHTNGGYSSDLSEFILDRPQIKCWVHGHTHDRFDYKMGDTRIVSNPRGYDGYEQCAETFQFKMIEV